MLVKLANINARCKNLSEGFNFNYGMIFYTTSKLFILDLSVVVVVVFGTKNKRLSKLL